MTLRQFLYSLFLPFSFMTVSDTLHPRLLTTAAALEPARDGTGRSPVESKRIFAATLRWLAGGAGYHNVADDFGIARSTVHKHVHRVIEALMPWARQQIQFPRGAELQQTIHDFQQKCELPNVAGAIDGSFIEIRKPSGEFADRYWCYKNKIAVLLLSVVDAVGRFTFIDAGRPSSVGDYRAFTNTELCRLLQEGRLFPPECDLTMTNSRTASTVTVHPYLLGDDAFALEAFMQKCYSGIVAANSPEARYNRCVIEGRRVVEQAFGRLKGTWRILLTRSNLNDPNFVAEVITVCCALHNFCENLRLERIFGVVPTGDQPPEEFATDPLPDVAATATGSNIRAILRDYLAGIVEIVR